MEATPTSLKRVKASNGLRPCIVWGTKRGAGLNELTGQMELPGSPAGIFAFDEGDKEDKEEKEEKEDRDDKGKTKEDGSCLDHASADAAEDFMPVTPPAKVYHLSSTPLVCPGAPKRKRWCCPSDPNRLEKLRRLFRPLHLTSTLVQAM